MPWSRRRALAAGAVLAAATGCAEHLERLEPSAGFETHRLFWPPPPPTSIRTGLLGSAAPTPSLAAAARDLANALRQAGYSQLRWYPIGLGHAHGFAVTTRLERIKDDGSPAADRWSALYTDAAELVWLAKAREPRLPGAGRYRTRLIAFTDLPIAKGSRPPVWNAMTVMDGPDVPASDLPATRVPQAYRTVCFDYEYTAEDSEGEGHLARR
jgi:hypothetical protein